MLNFRRDMFAAPRRRWELPVAGAAFAVLAVALFERVWITRSGSVAGIGNDPALFMWYLRWTPWAIAHGQDPLLTHHMLAPAGANLMWNTSVVLPAVVLWPVTALWGPEWSWNVLVTAGPALSAWVAYIALRRHASAPASAAGALLYGFSPALLAQAEGHPMISLAVYPPLAMLLVEDVVTSGSRRRRLLSGAALGIASAAQLLTGTELLTITVIAAAAGLAVLAALHLPEVRARARPVAEGLGVAAATGLVLGAFPLGVALAGPQHVSGQLWAPDVYVMDAAGIVVPGPFQEVAPDGALRIVSHESGNATETGGYLGLPLLGAAAAIVVVLRRRRAVLWGAGTLALVVVLALGPHLHVDGQLLRVPLPWRVFEKLPLLDSLLPVRFMVVAYLPLALLVAIGIDAAIRRRRAVERIAALALGVLVAVSLWPRPILAESYASAPFFTDSAPAGVLDGHLALVSPEFADHTAMLDQALDDFRFSMEDGAAFIPGPHFGPVSSPFTDELYSAEKDSPWTPPTAGQLAPARADLLSRGLDDVVVAPQPQEAQVMELMTAVLGAPTRDVDGVELWVLRHPPGS